jgi:hypothetical protein
MGRGVGVIEIVAGLLYGGEAAAVGQVAEAVGAVVILTLAVASAVLAAVILAVVVQVVIGKFFKIKDFKIKEAVI